MAKLEEVKCPRCRKVKRVADFYSNKSRSTGRSAHCKKCCIKAQQALYTPEEIKYKNREGSLRRKYGLTLEDYDQMCSDQDHRCAICDEAVKLVVDHDHETGAIRGLLCLNCNSGLGMFRDRLDLFDKAKEYLTNE